MSLLVLLDESELPWRNVLPYDGINFTYPDVLLEWAPTTQPTASSQTWVDITERLREWSWGYGRNDEHARFEAGTGHVLLDNNDRELDASYNAGGWFGNIKPRRMFRLRYRWSGTIYPGFVAYSRGLPKAYRHAGYDSVVRVDLVDLFAILQGVDLVVGFNRSQEASGARIGAVLDTIGVPAGSRDLDAGTVSIAALNVASAGTSGLDHAKAVALDSEMGQLFVAKDGRITFHDYARRLNASSLHTFTDDPAGPLHYGSEVDVAYDENYIWNYVRATGAAGDDTALTAQDAASQDDYYKLTKNVPTQLVSGSEIQQVADRYVLKYAQPEDRIPELPLNGAMNPASLWPVILDLEVSDRITWRRFSTAADPNVLTLNVEGMRHTCRAGGPWLTAVSTSPADTRAYMVADHATLGLADSGNLAA